MERPLLEVCIEDIESIISAEKAGVNRIEFCTNLVEGGTTPSLGMFRIARKKSKLPFNIMIRPRGGDFLYSDVEFETMLENVHIFREEGADAIVFGILDSKGNIDINRSAKIIEKAKGLPITFHRAFDMVQNPEKSLDDLINLGINRVLTSGQAPTVTEGLDNIKKLMIQAKNRITIMPGCGINPSTFPLIHKTLQASEYHGTFSEYTESKMEYRKPEMGYEYSRKHVSYETIKKIISLMEIK